MKTQRISAWLSLVLAVAIALLSVGCSGSEQQVSSLGERQQPYYTFTDDTGYAVVLEQKPQKVAVLFSSYAEIWQLAGGDVAVTVGESVARGFAAENTPLVDTGAGKTINQEALAASQPDFVLCSADIDAQVETARFLHKAGIPCGVFHVEQFEDYLRLLKICTDITGRTDAYITYGTAVGEQIDQILRAVSADQKEQKRILFIRAGSKASATKAKTAQDNFVCMMLQDLGAYNIAENAPVLLDGLSLEEIITEDPDYIFISTMGDEQAAKTYLESVFAQEAWQHLSAIEQGRYTFLPKDLFQFKPNARWAQAYQYLADLLCLEQDGIS